MSLSDIRIYRDLAVVNGYVQVPPNRERDKSRVSVLQALDTEPGASLTQLSLGSGVPTGSKFGAQRLLRLPPLHPGESYLSRYGYDPQDDLGWWHDAGVSPTGTA